MKHSMKNKINKKMVLILLTIIFSVFFMLPQAWAFTKPGKPDKPDKPTRPKDPQVQITVTADKEVYLTPTKAKITVNISGEGKVNLYYKFYIPTTSNSLPAVNYINEIYIPMAEDWEVTDTTFEYTIPLIALWPNGHYAFGVVATKPHIKPSIDTIAEGFATFEVEDRRNNTFIEPGPDGIDFSVADIFSIESEINNGTINGVVMFKRPNGDEIWSKTFNGTYEFSIRDKKLYITLEGEDGYRGGQITLIMDNRTLYLTAETNMGRSAQLSYNFAESTFTHNFERSFDPVEFKNATSFTFQRGEDGVEVVFESERPNGKVITKGFRANFDHEEGATNFRIESAANPNNFIELEVENDGNSLTVEFEDGQGHKVGKTINYPSLSGYDLNFDDLYEKGVSLEH